MGKLTVAPLGEADDYEPVVETKGRGRKPKKRTPVLPRPPKTPKRVPKTTKPAAPSRVPPTSLRPRRTNQAAKTRLEYLEYSLNQAEDAVEAALADGELAQAASWKRQALKFRDEYDQEVAKTGKKDPAELSTEERLALLRRELTVWPDEYLELALEEYQSRQVS